MADEETLKSSGSETRLASIRNFNQLVAQDYDLTVTLPSPERNKERERVRNTILGIIKEQGNEGAQNDFLWETIRQRIIDSSASALSILRGGPARRFYGVDQPPLSVQDQITAIQESSFDIFATIHAVKDLYRGIALDVYDPEEPLEFPYNNLDQRQNLDIVRICANLGHDFTSLPGFNYLVYDSADRLIRRPEIAMGSPEETSLVLRTLPLLYQGLIWSFEAYGEMAKGSYPQKDGASLSEVLRVTLAETAIRAFKRDGSRFEFTGQVVDHLVLKGNEAGLHLLFYQFLKNSVMLLRKPINRIDQPKISLEAKNIQVAGHDLIAVRMIDNGPGLDIAGILRAKQRLLKEKGEPLSVNEQKIAGDWAALDLRILDVVNFIFERRISALDRAGTPHSGIGLAMAKEIIDRHGGCVWATNLSGEFGAKFLLIFDPSKDGSLRANLPQLFQTEKVPADLLEGIDKQL